MSDDQLRQAISEILVKWNMPTRQVAINELMALIRQDRRELLQRLLDKGAAMTEPDKKGNVIRWWPDGFNKVLHDELQYLTGLEEA